MIKFKFNGTAGGLLLKLWAVFPVLGNLLPPLFIVMMLLSRDRLTSWQRDLVWFAGLCLIYTIYISARAFTAGPFHSAIEPVGDTFSLLITTLLAAFTVRRYATVNKHQLYKLLVAMITVVLVLCLVERFAFEDNRPELLLGNPLNLTPLLIVPALLCTFRELSPSPIWSILGIIALFFTTITVGGVSDTRGPFLVLVALCSIRISNLLLKSKRNVLNLRWAGAMTCAIVCACLIINTTASGPRQISTVLLDLVGGTETKVSEKFDAAGALQVVSDGSVNIRITLLRAGWAAYLEKPIFGHGPQYRFEAAIPHFPETFQERYSHLHNEFLTHAVAGGLPAVILLFLILVTPFLAAWRQKHDKGLKREIGLLFTLAFSGTAMFNNVLFVDISAFSLGLSYAAALILINSLSSCDN